MSVIFTNLALAGLLALAAVPIIVHLFARTKPPSYQFSDNRFLRKILKKSARFQKPQDWILLLLRCLAVLAIVAAFLHPLLISNNDSAGVGQKKSVVLVIDRSASMAAIEGATSRFDKAVQSAQAILKESDFDVANIVWLDADPDSVFPEAGENVGYLEEQLAMASASYENGAIERALELAVSQVEAVKGSKQIILISDFQKANWSNLAVNVPKGISLETLSVSKEPVGNMSIADLFTSPRQPILGEPVDLIATLSNFSNEDRRVKVYIDSGGGRSTKEVDVPAWSSSQVMHTVKFTSAGETVLSARIEEDKFPRDDVSYNTLMVRDRLRMAVIGKSSPQAIERLGYALPWLEVEKVSDLDKASVYDFVLVPDWSGGEVEKLHQLIKSGVGVLLVPNDNLAKKDAQQLLAQQVIGSLALQENASGWSVSITDDSYQAMKLFATGEYGIPGEGKHTKRLALKKEIEGMQVLLSYNDGVPALLRKRVNDEGSLVFFNMSFDREVSDWGERTSFVSFMAEMLLAERRSSTSESYTLPGSPLGYFPGNGVDKQSVQLLHNEETLDLRSSQTSSGLQLISQPIEAPGIYRWVAGKDELKASTVNLVTTESDLRTMDPSDLSVGDVVTTKQLPRRASLGDGLSLWGIFIGLAVVFLFLEMIIATLKPKAKEERA